MVIALMITAVVETVLRNDLPWPIASLLVCLICLPGLLWRRTHPLRVLIGTFVGFHVVSLGAFLVGAEGEGTLYTSAFVLILVYSLFRWGSGREAGIGLVILTVVFVVDMVTAFTGWDDAIGGFVILLFTAELGAIIRYQYSSRVRRGDEIRLQEREQLARELHDIVAHHVSAIAVQAQAGIAVAATDPHAATGVLVAIEQEASRTLTELRFMVGALREGDEADLAPQHGVTDIRELADHGLGAPTVDVELHGELDSLRPAIQTAIYRMAQESITNARRHARDATRVLVRVTGDEEFVHLVVSDNGLPALLGTVGPAGYGLAGMAERAKLLGGTLEAGPSPAGGWRVNATIPSSGIQSSGIQSSGAASADLRAEGLTS